MKRVTPCSDSFLFREIRYNNGMKKLTYRILVYLMLVLGIGGMILLIVEAKLSGTLNIWALIGLAVLILSILGLVLVQCIYRVTKKPLATLDQTKECPMCHTINDRDAEFCKKCGEKFKNF